MGYIITKLFIYDVDVLLIERFLPEYAWLLTYKFFIIIGVVSIVWLISKNAQIMLWSLFVVFYPLVIFLWRIPYLIFKKKSWNIAFAFFDSIIYFFMSLKKGFIMTSIFLIASLLVLKSSGSFLLWLSICSLMALVLLVYILKLFFVFKSSGVYQTYSKFFNSMGETFRTSSIYRMADEDAILPLEKMQKHQIEKWVSHVQVLALINHACLFVAKKLQVYRDSGFNIVASVFGVLFLALYTVLSFALINFGLYKINHDIYSVDGAPSFFIFFYYSFNLLLFNSIHEVVATAPLSQIVYMIQSFFVLFLVAILISLVLTHRSQKYTDELNDAVQELSKERIRIEEFIKNRYRIDNIEIVMSLLRKLDASFISWINAMIKEIS